MATYPPASGFMLGVRPLRYRPNMKISQPDVDRYWHQMVIHTTASRANGSVSSPWPVVIQLASLVGNADIAASVSHFDAASGRSWSGWSVALITADNRLARVVMQFEAEQYDGAQERESTDEVGTTVVESWIRRLSDVVSLEIGNARMRPTTMNRVMSDQLDVADVRLRFTDGVAVDLSFDQLAMTVYDERGRSDAFLDVLRNRTGL